MAVTVVLLLRVTVQFPVPGQATPEPLHPVNVEPASATAESVMLVPPLNEATHVAPQLIPDGVKEVTVPVPVPALMIVNVGLGGITLNVADTVTSAVSVNVQVVVATPLQAPPHAPNVLPESGLAVKVTDVPQA